MPAPIFALEVNALMAGFGRPWCIAGPWALELFLHDRGERNGPAATAARPAPVTLAIFRIDQQALRDYLYGWHFQYLAAGVARDWTEQSWIEQPLYELSAHQPRADPPRLCIELFDLEAEHWVYRRHQRIRRHRDSVILRTPQGIPVLAPEITLLDAHDTPAPHAPELEAALGLLPPPARRWLHTTLRMLQPEHPWLTRLQRPG